MRRAVSLGGAKGGRAAQEHQFFDNLVSEAFQAYLDEGQPAAVADRPGRYVEAPDRDDVIMDIKKMIRSSADHLGIGIRFGDTERVGRNRVRVTFTAQHRKEYKRRGMTTD